jgi:hypothetical protein
VAAVILLPSDYSWHGISADNYSTVRFHTVAVGHQWRDVGLRSVLAVVIA